MVSIVSNDPVPHRFFRGEARRSINLLVEVACGGGRGRTGSALACIAQLAGVPEDQATAWVRRHYDRRSVETPWQRCTSAASAAPGPSGTVREAYATGDCALRARRAMCASGPRTDRRPARLEQRDRGHRRPGIGKTELLDYAVESAHSQGMAVLRARGVESDAEAPFGGLLELLLPALDALERIPAFQAEALRGALALGPPTVQDRFVIGAATLSMLSAHSESTPVARGDRRRPLAGRVVPQRGALRRTPAGRGSRGGDHERPRRRGRAARGGPPADPRVAWRGSRGRCSHRGRARRVTGLARVHRADHGAPPAEIRWR